MQQRASDALESATRFAHACRCRCALSDPFESEAWSPARPHAAGQAGFGHTGPNEGGVDRSSG